MEKDKLQETIQELRNAAATGSPECCALVDKAVGALLDMAAEVEQVKRERDAAVAGIGLSKCKTCKHEILEDSMQELDCMANDYDCKTCDAECRCKDCNNGSAYEWRFFGHIT